MVNTKLNSNHVFNLISEIPDPEIPVLTIKDLGILRDVKWMDNSYQIDITPTYTACPAIPFISDEIKRILGDYGIQNYKLSIVYEPAWSTDWLTNEAKLKLKQYGIAPPRHTSCAKKLDSSKQVQCPRCNSHKTTLLSQFGSTACKALYTCDSCKEVFDYFKCH